MLKREYTRLNGGERALFAKLVRTGDHLRHKHHISRRTGHHNEFAIGCGLERETRILHTKFDHHLQHLVRFHVAQVYES